jgi:cell division protein ZipA
MDPDLLRFLLVVLGVVLVLGIYLWDRYKRALPPARNRRVINEPVIFDDPPVEPVYRETQQDDPRPSDPVPAAVEEVELPQDGPVETVNSLDPDPAPEEIDAWSETADREEPQMTMGLNFDAHGDGDYLTTDPALQDDVERKLIVIHLTAPQGMLAGPAIAAACEAVGLVLGDMSIYHRVDESSGSTLFSLASMVEPGTIPTEGLADFKTPGLAMFTQLPGARDGVQIYDEMLQVADRMAGLLHAEIRDERRNKLTRQMRDHMRESIIDHRQRVRLARSRH